MISFEVITKENFESISEALGKNVAKEEREVLSEIVTSYVSDEENSIEYAVALAGGCALLRVFDMGRYCFIYPYALSGQANIAVAISALSEYAMREEIPLAFSDVPSEEIHAFAGFRHITLDAEDAQCGAYRVNILTECSLLSEIPEVDAGRVKLNAITEADIPDYARLSKSENVNKYWGYDYKEDITSPADSYFYEMAMRDFNASVAISLAIREKDKFVGEAVLYAFDGRGGAEFAIRLLPEATGRGLGKESVSAVFLIAEKIGLVTLRSKVLNENSPSHGMLKNLMDIERTEENAVYYIKSL